MEHEKLVLGDAGSLCVILKWRNDYETNGPVGKTWGDLQLWLKGTLVWGKINKHGDAQGITWSWIEILEFLGNAWPYLIEEEQYPITFSNHLEEPKHLGELWGRSKIRLSNLSEELADEEDMLLRDFLAVHDLSEALQGARPTELLFLRQGKNMLAATVRQEWVLSYGNTMSTFLAMGNAIMDRIAGLTDKRSVIARTRWEQRDLMPNSKRLQIAVGRDELSLRKIWPIDITADAVNDKVYELKAAARMIGRKISDDKLKFILDKIYNLPKGGSFALSYIQSLAVNVIAESENQDPVFQGYLLAAMLRSHLECEVGKVDPESILGTWQVSIHRFEDKDLLLDAVAVWGTQHAPTIILNQAGPRAQHPTGTRSTLAHEICHLLIDIEGALPAVEVLGGNISRSVEKRANAFSAEFLLPRAEAGASIKTELQFVYIASERDNALDQTVNFLAAKYGTSHEMTAWQILNSGGIDDDRLINHLKKYLNSVFSPFDVVTYRS